ncbi:MAG: type II secretion system protein, partial [Candidatus Nanoperiomorbaceae bacterium]
NHNHNRNNNQLRHSIHSSNPMGGGINGFTIIEVALVLAIAGLIFLVVFIAWPALQNSQADTARRQDVGRVVSAIESYKVDNQGSIYAYANGNHPWDNHGQTHDALLGAYIGKLNTILYVSIETNVTTYQAWLSGIDIYPNQGCATDGSNNLSPNSGSYAVVTKLSSGAYYCQTAS